MVILAFMKTLAFGKGKMHHIVIFKGKFWVPLNDTVIIFYETVWNRVVGGGGGGERELGARKIFLKQINRFCELSPQP